ncbi:acyl-CoA desaturase [Actibacterium sp. 188UL27-1]|uniref:acyl-CoA desaturase n=1 Tax=Actibacterium sp. 188UL27-1 TaxID=2786961 RepID=UPI00195F043F|nr:acyl-CoA desaturase [Actibacterium sp. 188UL27-1]MBM7069360.1 acyl-CoA desaturase [Actibacterium sp. 188UL27-1]
MTHLISTERVLATAQTSATDGQIRVLPGKTLWLATHGLGGLAGIILFPRLDALVVFLALSAVTICAGHSVGMHRLLIHRSFKTSKPVEYGLVWLGVLVGMAGPIGMIRAHDMRDWHQRQAVCPPHPAHGAGFWRDAWWQLCCEFRLTRPPQFTVESEVSKDPIYFWMERTWMLQQLPVAVLLYVLGGWAWVLWGGCLRIFVSLVGHWMVGHFAHKGGHQGWQVMGLPVQGYNLRGLGLITFGENWHGNHHAFPHSAKLGVEDGQSDPGYLFIHMLAWLGIAWDINGPSSAPERDGLRRLTDTAKNAEKNALDQHVTS